jgi:hypothetical protein
MKRLSDEDSLINQQAATVAASVLSETVEAATRCEQLTRATRAEAHGIGRVSRFFMRVDDAAPAVSGLGQEGKYLRAAGLPNSFILAVTAGSVYALEDKRDRGYVVPGQVLRSWVRGGFRASLDPAALQRAEGGVRHVFRPHRFMVARDAPSQRVIDALGAMVTSGITFYDQNGQPRKIGATPIGDPMDQLSKLAELRDRGVLTDEEFAAQKAKILGES